MRVALAQHRDVATRIEVRRERRGPLVVELAQRGLVAAGMVARPRS